MIPVSPFIKYYDHGSSVVIQLNRPQALNALTPDMLHDLYHMLKTFEYQKDVIIFKGLEKVFCAGGDVKTFLANSSKTHYRDGLKFSGKIVDLLSNYKKPYIALVDGIAFGAASLFAMSGQYRVVTEKTLYCMPETAIGYVVDAGSTYFLPRLENNLGVYMALTGARLKGFELKKVNLATHFVKSSQLDELENQLVKCNTHEDVQKVLKDFDTIPSPTESDLDLILPKIEECFRGTSIEEILDNLKKDGSDWALETIQTLNKMSPTSLKVVHRSITLGRLMPLRDCVKMEFRLCGQNYINIQSDFREGVRALLVDKDKKPKWNPQSVEEVKEKHIARFFWPLVDGDEIDFEEKFINKL